ncbi:MAG: tRNA (N(6)-L-threonylcarbamoyladenosine(37)-C(2))-methylthiotransferase MtaB [Dehalococcoidales bacterium]|nr:MAG: tRNA (N(6)-L-threonylcarbamoyladenosine(37)-C(2))-methylthiotransferase MtaB [Dehalococcoidales bacterium]
MNIAIETLGCKLNQAETELLARQFLKAGYRLVSATDAADIYILNTCTVTSIADAKSRHLLRLAHRQNPDAVLVATGCYAQRAPAELAQIEGVALVTGNEDKPELLQRLKESGYLENHSAVPENALGHPHPAFRTRAFIKVQEGCSSFCSYCVVPLVRVKEKSLAADRVIGEINKRIASGYREVVLTGTKIGSYNDDGVTLQGLLERILGETDIARLRLSSLQPQEITTGLLHLWRNERLCPHFHLSLQSGCGTVLKRMGRRYTTADYQRVLELIRNLVPDAAITTDVITGFPGETDAEFAESYQLCQQLAFARIHVFPYSPRSGTKAARLPDQVDHLGKKQRAQQMLTLAKSSSQNFNQRFLGRIMTVLWENQSGGLWSGLTGNYIKVYCESNKELTSQILPVKLEELYNRDRVWGQILF